MAKENLQQLRQLIAQQAARMMAEDGISDYSYAKKKAGRQVGAVDNDVLPSNAEIEEELKLYNALFLSDEQPENLRMLRKNALFTMQLLERFNPYLTGAVLDGTAGLGAETHIHLFADSLKDVEMFLLNQDIPFQTNEKSYRVMNDGKRDKKGDNRKKVPVFSLEMSTGIIKLSVFEVDEIRTPTKRAADGSNAVRADIQSVKFLLNQ
ncbi:hypothetical protein [Methylotenera sp.]|uniref:hypothetical protein n=1 Tax=Methylotenera sp. TaxID=2051956 RepID=UPI0027259590|nr:hypothetical protein [Methylotenera sp.]MDO9205402.1 hypothetical protein [Methylotenera sp.]MDO9393731.1 hypothetical protein [Methylotenera sp.]MDP2070583.1 hypothetical protein [Methylotenera sp.]MDP3006183.1 hypothetical protein [Methylotenera sp.]MDP3307986.1 hypothetical protein [Methylotenera sp.]